MSAVQQPADPPATVLRQQLRRNGYRPVPVSDPNPMLSAGGKAPLFKDWRKVASNADAGTIAAWPSTIRNHGNTGLLCGNLIGLDLDIPVQALADQVADLADTMLPATPLHRVGQAPKSLRCFRAETPLPKLETPELLLPGGSKVQVEALGAGQQFVAYGTHPGTGRPYTWPREAPDDVALDELPILPEPVLRAFLAEAETLLRAAGGRTEAEIKKDANPEPDSTPAIAIPAVAPAKHKGKGEFFRAVNKAALGNIGAWLPSIFPKATEEAGTKAWRVASVDMGRGLEEDLSIHPTEGGRDFGTRKSCSPIDVVIEHGGAADAPAAALWLCERLGTDPATLGWKAPREKKERPKREDRAPTDKPLIRIEAGELHTMATATEDALIAAGVAIYQRGNSLVRPVTREAPASHGRTTMAAGLSEVTLPVMVDLMCHVAEWEKWDARAGAWVRANPPRQVAEILLSRAGFWRVPTVVGVVTTPTMRPDGSILSVLGYDADTRLYHAADPTLTVHPAVQKPTRADAEKALVLLSELLGGFPFVDDVSRAVALSAIITPVVRGAIPVAPMHLFRAPTAGTGKSYLADVVSVILTGRLCPVITAAPDEAETEKRLVGLLLAGFPLVSLDNCNGEIGGDLLCQLIERQFIRVRALGRSDITEIESRATALATGNNARVRGDMVRRTVISDLDAGIERPETRVFSSDPVTTIQGDRSRYVSACLIIVRAYLIAEQPGKLPPIASFGAWSDLVRSALVWLGCADPAKSMEQAREDDPELGELREVLEAWKEAFGTTAVTVRHAIDVATIPVSQGDGHQPYGGTTVLPYPALKDALMRVAGVRGVIDAKRLGYWLRARMNRPVGVDCFKRGEDNRDSIATWRAWTTSR